MSPLTKVFVVLHVVLSLLLTAGLVVFVNRVEDFNLAAKQSQTALMAANGRAAQSDAAAQAAQNQVAQIQQQTASQLQAMESQQNQLKQQLGDANARLADSSAKYDMASADINRLTEGLKASEDQKSKQQDMIAQLRGTGDDLVKKNADLNMQVADLTNKLDVTERARREFAEQVTQAKNDVERLTGKLTEAGLNPTTPVPGPRLSAPPINGVIREVRDISGNKYATISVGSADAVTPGMQFNVIDRDKGEFLGRLTVQNVEPNEATGRLEGPHVDQIGANAEVRTQL